MKVKSVNKEWGTEGRIFVKESRLHNTYNFTKPISIRIFLANLINPFILRILK